VEDLGGGLKAWFQMESSAQPDGTNNATGGQWGTRNSGVGLQGAWGTFGLGRWDSPFKRTSLLNDPTGQLTIADPLAVINDKTVFNRRETNVAMYWTPVIAGFYGEAMYAANEGKTTTANPNTISLMAKYSTGPFVVAYSWEKHKDQAGSTVTAGVDDKGQMVVGTAKFGPLTLGVTAQKFKRAAPTAATQRTDLKTSLVTAQYDNGMHSFFALYGRAKDGKLGTALPTDASPEGKQIGVGYYYNFSKRTTFVAVYTKITNNSTANYTFNGSGSGTFTVSANQDPKGMGFGFRHLF
jgi:predicted porin